MSTFSYQVLKDTNQKTVIKLTGQFSDNTPEDNASRIQANSLFGGLDSSRANLLTYIANTGPLSYYGLEVTKLWYDVNMYNSTGKGHVVLYWSGDGGGVNNSPIFAASDIGNWDEHGSYANIQNNAVNPNGDIGVKTYGAVANSSYTFVIELRKDNNDYSRGQLEDPAAFNYGPYSIKP